MAVALCYLVCALVWSTTWFAIRVCIGPGGYATFPAAALRFSIAAAVLIALVAIGLGRPGPASRRQWLALACAGLFNGLGYACVYRAEEDLPGGLVSVLFGTLPLFTAILAAATGAERVRRSDVAAALVALVGMTVLFWDRLSISPEQAVGVGFGIAAVLFSLSYNVVYKRESGSIHPLSGTAVFLSVAALVLWVISLPGGHAAFPRPVPVAPTVALLYLALCGSVLTFVCFFYMLRRVSLMTASSLVLVQPVIALLVDALWETDVRLTARSYVGAVITLAAVAAGLVWKWRAARAAA